MRSPWLTVLSRRSFGEDRKLYAEAAGRVINLERRDVASTLAPPKARSTCGPIRAGYSSPFEFNARVIRPAASVLVACAIAAPALAQHRALPASCRQCILVLTDSWEATHGTLSTFERDRSSAWCEHGLITPVLIGKAGLAWGRGVIDTAGLSGPVKIEGDNKAPAGVFRLGTVFGRAKLVRLTRMPYLPLSANILAIDDPQSRYYNQLVDVTQVRDRDWHRAENMILSDHRYDWGVFVKHNLPPQSGVGSCIFLHVWKNSATLTTGCTAMPEAKLLELIHWLDSSRDPVLTQLPQSIYNELRATWRLPAP
jgi:L,D-peptidoglycan transpeptidase YkuD (ErfK/YbiS/YcfS/YnhG family)